MRPNWSTSGVSKSQVTDSPSLHITINMRTNIVEFQIWPKTFLVSIIYAQRKRARVPSNFHESLQTVFLNYSALVYLEAKIISLQKKKKKKVTQYWLITQNTVNICYSRSITEPFEVYEEIWFLSSWKAHSFYILNDHVSKITKKNLLSFERMSTISLN